jgi:16S rRNA (adenine1518-N6/adenine1519-N6)-dimethyltransferase
MIPRKRFGQNFLQDNAVIHSIVHALSPQPGQNLVEIGPGQGALTLPILKLIDKKTRMSVIEIDWDLAKKIQGWPHNINIIEADALTVDFRQFCPPKIRLFGNLPYNISTPLLLHLLSFVDCLEDAHFMVQKEVAERISANPGNKDYGRLSVMIQYFCETELLFDVPPTAFYPQPKVDSSVIRLIPHSTPIYPSIAFEKLESVVKQAFAFRRKTLRNNFKNILSEKDWQTLAIAPSLRPEQLDVAKFVRIAQFLV